MSMKPNSTAAKEAVKLKAIKADSQLSEQELKERAKALMENRVKKCADEINEILKKHNCVIRPEIDIKIQDRAIGVTLVAL